MGKYNKYNVVSTLFDKRAHGIDTMSHERR